MPLNGTKVLGQYQLLSRMATGGMAEIFLARQTGIRGFEKLVVVKKILPHLVRQKEFVEMFFDEARIAARLRHPNIVQIYDLGQSGEDYFIAMEYLEGESLRGVLVQSFKVMNRLPPELAAFIIANICDGLDYAHKFRNETGNPLNIVHRDISPNNIIILYSGGVKLVDFGVAKTAVQAHQTEVGVLRGKLSYMSPEQCLGKPLDHRSDIFSTGVVLWELLAQRRLFKRNTEQKTIRAVITLPIPPVTEFREEVPEELDAIAHRAMEREQAKRYQSAGEMGDAIRDVLRDLNAIVGHQEIATYMQTIFSEKANERQEFLEKLRSDPGTQMDIDDEETSQSSSDTAVTDSRTPEDPATKELSTGMRTAPAIPPFVVDEADIKDSGKGTELPTRSSRFPPDHFTREKKWTLFASLGAIALVLIVGVTLLTMGDDTPKKQEADEQAADEEEPEDDVINPDQLVMLTIRSKPPGCKVKVNGIGIPTQTPIEDLALDPGMQHSVVVICANCAPERRQISGDPGKRITLDFAPKPYSGFLSLETVPWSEVYLGKRKLGTTPLAGIKLPAGTHRLIAVNPGLGLKKSFNIEIRPKRTTTRRVRLSP